METSEAMTEPPWITLRAQQGTQQADCCCWPCRRGGRSIRLGPLLLRCASLSFPFLFLCIQAGRRAGGGCAQLSDVMILLLLSFLPSFFPSCPPALRRISAWASCHPRQPVRGPRQPASQPSYLTLLYSTLLYPILALPFLRSSLHQGSDRGL